MSWMASLDGYCERIAPGFGAEPFNTLTGLAFLVAGAIAVARAPAADDRNAGLALAAVGVASAASHAAGVMLTAWLDLAANLIWMALLGVLLLRRLADAGRLAALAGATVAVAVAHLGVNDPALRALAGPWADLFVVELCVLLVLALLLRQRHPVTARGLAVAVAVLAAGLPFRFLDAALCPVWPAGTHGIWHLLNAASAFVLLAALARHGATGGPRLAQRQAGR